MPNLDDNPPEIVFGYGQPVDDRDDGELPTITVPKNLWVQPMMSPEAYGAAVGELADRYEKLFKLMDRIAPNFIEMVEEYHLSGDLQSCGNCYLCNQMKEVQEYIERRKIGKGTV